MSKQKTSLLYPHRKLIKQLVRKNPNIINREIIAALPIKVSEVAVSRFRRQLGLPCNLPNAQPSILEPYRKLFERLVKENPKISNEKLSKLLPIKVHPLTVRTYRNKLGLPTNSGMPMGEIDKYSKLIERLVRKNPKISCRNIAKMLPVKFSIPTIARFRLRAGLPNANHSSLPGQSVLDPFRNKITRLVRKNPGISNREIIEILKLDVSMTAMAQCRRDLKLPSSIGNRSHVLDPYRKKIEKLVKKNPNITNQEIANRLPIYANQGTVAGYRHRLGLPCNTAVKIHLYRELIERLVRKNPRITNKKIIELLPIKVDNSTLAQYRRKLGLPCNPKVKIHSYRKLIERLIRKNPRISNQKVVELLPIKVHHATVGQYRRKLGLPCNPAVPDSVIERYRKQIETMVRKNPGITNVEIRKQLAPMDISDTTIGKYRRLWGLPWQHY
jgi:uncharacterized protein YneF (UPF0154 family)